MLNKKGKTRPAVLGTINFVHFIPSLRRLIGDATSPCGATDDLRASLPGKLISAGDGQGDGDKRSGHINSQKRQRTTLVAIPSIMKGSPLRPVHP